MIDAHRTPDTQCRDVRARILCRARRAELGRQGDVVLLDDLVAQLSESCFPEVRHPLRSTPLLVGLAPVASVDEDVGVNEHGHDRVAPPSGIEAGPDDDESRALGPDMSAWRPRTEPLGASWRILARKTSPRSFETEVSRLDASTRAQRAVSSSSVIVTFLSRLVMTRISCYTNVVSIAPVMRSRIDLCMRRTAQAFPQERRDTSRAVRVEWTNECDLMHFRKMPHTRRTGPRLADRAWY